MHIIEQLEKEEALRLGGRKMNFASGDTVVVRTHVLDGSARRLQSFEGVVIARRGRGGVRSSFIVRRASSGETMERTFHLHSPLIESITVTRHGKVRKAKLYSLRNKSGRAARIPEKLGRKKETKPR